MEKVSSTEANREFSKLLARARAGEETTITVHGVPVAKLVPYRSDAAEMERQKREHLEFLRQNPVRGASRGTRDELYDE